MTQLAGRDHAAVHEPADGTRIAVSVLPLLIRPVVEWQPADTWAFVEVLPVR